MTSRALVTSIGALSHGLPRAPFEPRAPRVRWFAVSCEVAVIGHPKPTISTPGSSDRGSLCEAFRDAIIAKLDLGHSAQRIWQDLAAEDGSDGSYQGVRRFYRRLRATSL